ncbi:hypothetical protein H8B17_13880 [Sphingobacterium arenae]|uniref:Lipoprotein n=1 Tax=Sphingobacterium arenae TaxID=1280598 RepID=A0ABR7Y5V3_9SPHI|nr:hypothetical protein [Sphingobacterium arenae]MBD1426676.1 hypothetical protein [Sphingobacterium arenae]
MSETFKALSRIKIYFVYLSCVLYLSACSTTRHLTHADLTGSKTSAISILDKQVDEFNSYIDRPASDGHIDKRNNKAFLRDNIPLFLCSDSNITKVYNYRWWMISKHLKAYVDPYDEQTYGYLRSSSATNLGPRLVVLYLARRGISFTTYVGFGTRNSYDLTLITICVGRPPVLISGKMRTS